VSLNVLKRDLGLAIRELRKLRNLTQEELAGRCDLHTNEIGRIERGRTNPTLETIYLIATKLQTDAATLFVSANKISDQ
jgi:transcriptional regulator with XRE-family HTH domain